MSYQIKVKMAQPFITKEDRDFLFNQLMKRARREKHPGAKAAFIEAALDVKTGRVKLCGLPWNNEWRENWQKQLDEME